jgi:hypothetical protein
LAPPAGSQPLPRWTQGPLSVSCRPGTPTYKLQVKTRSGACTHMSPRDLQHRTLPPSRGGLQGCHVSSRSGSRLLGRKGFGVTTCIVAGDPASLQGRALVRHLSCSSRSYLPVGEDSGAPRVIRLWILPLYREGSGAATTYPAVSCGPQKSSVKKSLAGVSVQVGTHVLNARIHVP